MHPVLVAAVAGSAVRPAVIIPGGGWAYGANGTYQPLAATSGVPAGTSLTTHTGGYTITTSGTSISGMNVTGGIDIKTSNVTVSSSRVRGQSPNASGACVDMRWTGCVNALLQDCEVAPDVPQTYLNCVMGHDYTAQRCNVHAGTDGFRASTNNNNGGNIGTVTNVHLLGCYSHGNAGWVSDPAQGNGPSHSDPLQYEGGNNSTVIGNNFDGRIDPTLGNGTATASTWNGGQHSIPGSLDVSQCNQWNRNTTPSITSGIILNNNWFDYAYIAINMGSLGAGNHIDSIQNNLFGHHTASGVQINLVGTTVGTLSGNAFVDGVGSIVTHA
ncbi:MAG TPA: hypothetical protein VIJ31_12185 [Acidothermaceae bacterium]